MKNGLEDYYVIREIKCDSAIQQVPAQQLPYQGRSRNTLKRKTPGNCTADDPGRDPAHAGTERYSDRTG